MSRGREKAKTSDRGTVAILCDELTRLARLVDECRRSGRPVEEELRRRLPALRGMITKLEQDLPRTESERGKLEALYGVSRAIGSSLDLQEVLNEVMDQIIRLTGAERAFLMLLDPDSGDLEFRAARNVDRETIASSSFEISRSIVQQVATSAEPVVTTNAQMDPRFKTKDSVVGYNLRSILCVPLRVRGEITGVVYADNRIRTGLFDEHDCSLLATFASQAAVAIENARLFERVSDAKTLMDNVFASMTSGVITTDAEGRISFFNRAARRILQLPPSVFVRSRFVDALPGLERELRPLIERVKADGEPIVDFEFEISLSTRGPVTLRASVSPLKDAHEETQGIAIVIDDLTEQRHLEARYQLFQRYLSPAVIERLPDDPGALRLGGHRQEVTSLFADIRGFTDFSQHYDPETLVEVLNQYLDVGAKAVLAEEGTLDKFMGDAVVALFNAPLPQSDHVLRAVRAAWRIQKGVVLLHDRLPPAYQLGYGIGITVGDAVVGNVGTARRLDYTAIGPSVNLARRLQEAAAPGQTLLTRAVYRQVQTHVQVRPLDPIRVEGFGDPVDVCELLGLR